jgi:hypothetical protein
MFFSRTKQELADLKKEISNLPSRKEMQEYLKIPIVNCSECKEVKEQIVKTKDFITKVAREFDEIKRYLELIPTLHNELKELMPLLTQESLVELNKNTKSLSTLIKKTYNK